MKKRKILEYNVVFQEEQEGGYSAWVPELAGCASQGETFEEALANIKEAIDLYLESSLDVNTDNHEDYKKQFVIPVRIQHA